MEYLRTIASFTTARTQIHQPQFWRLRSVSVCLRPLSYSHCGLRIYAGVAFITLRNWRHTSQPRNLHDRFSWTIQQLHWNFPKFVLAIANPFYLNSEPPILIIFDHGTILENYYGAFPIFFNSSSKQQTICFISLDV